MDVTEDRPLAIFLLAAKCVFVPHFMTSRSLGSSSCPPSPQQTTSYPSMIFLLISLGIGLIFLLASFQRRRSAYLHGRARNDGKAGELQLSYSPNSLTPIDLCIIIFDILLKYIPGRTPPLQAHENDTFLLPYLQLHGLLKLTAKDFDHFRIACNTNDTSSNASKANPMYLVSAVGPLLFLLLSHSSCPIRPFGAVNTRNRFVFHDKSFCNTISGTLDADRNDLSFTATIGGAGSLGRRKKRGVEFDIVVKVFRQSEVIMAAHCSFLQFLSKSVRPLYQATPGEDKKTTPMWFDAMDWTSVRVPVSKNAPQRWAVCSKDYNPIHVSDVLAKLFGFPSAIAHGNHVVALLLEQLRRQSSSNQELLPLNIMVSEMLWGRRSIAIDVNFVKPMTPLPLELEMKTSKATKGEPSTRDEPEISFGLLRKDKVYVMGSISYVDL